MLQHAVALHQSGRVAEAVPIYQRIVKRSPRAAGVFNLLGIAQFQLGNLPAAADAMRCAIKLNPALPNAEYNLARALQGMGEHEAALSHYRRAIVSMPGDAEALGNLGTVLAALGRHGEAIEVYQQAVAIKRDYAEAWFNLGNALEAGGRHADAERAFERAIGLRPEHAGAHGALGLTLHSQGRHVEAIAKLERAIALNPDQAEAHINLGNALSALDRHAEAAAHFEAGIALKPADADAHVNLGNALSALDRDKEAIESFDRAIALRPDCSDALWNKCLFYLSRGRFAEGWPLFEHRWTKAANPRRPYRQATWNGERVAGTLLVWGEQGLGDQVMLAGLAGELRERAERLVLEVDPRLVSLLGRSLPGIEVVPQLAELYDEPVAAQAPLGDLCRHLRPDLASFARLDSGYLAVDPARAADLRRRLHPDHRRAIGISWVSKAKNTGTAKSARLDDLLPILRLPDCRFVDLQYGDTAPERQALERAHGICIEHLDDIDNTNDIEGLAALIAACDAVVTVSNTTAHLAGAQGKATWVLVPYGYGRLWYWQRTGRRAPFYRSVSLCRQMKEQTWAGLIRSIADEVARALPAAAASPVT